MTIPAPNFHQELAIDVSTDEKKQTAESIELNGRKRSIGQFLKKYFLEGQKLDHLQMNPNDSGITSNSPKWAERHRNLIAFLIPFCFCHFIWWTCAFRYNLFERYSYRYQMPITMVFGAFISGATSEGGGAVAFPVMTLLLQLDPTVARDFSLMIQSCGMAASGFSVLWMRIRVEWNSIIICSFGAFVSVILGLQFGDDVMSAQVKKMVFVSVWFSFAVSLFILNTQHKRIVYDQIPQFNLWKGILLFITGLVGGWLTALTGSGVDICSFCVLTLLFRVSEKVATPTSVVLMWLNTWMGFYWREIMMNRVSTLAWEYFSVSAPIVCIMSPIGAFLASIVHRQVLAGLVYLLETLSVIGFLLTRPEWTLVLSGLLIILIGTVFFMGMSSLGKRLSGQIEKSTDLAPIFGSQSCTTNSPTSSNESPLAN